MLKTLEQFFERALWSSRLVVLVAVVASALVGIGIFFVSSVDVVQILGHLITYASPALSESQRDAIRADLIANVVEVVDGYLFGTIMLIFALGLYELFISKIDFVEGSELAARVLLIQSLDDLKDRLAKVVLLILVVKFFQYALKLKYQTPLDLLFLALGVLLISGALFLSHYKSHKP